MGVMPMRKAKGMTNYKSLLNNVRKMGPLMRHFEYLMELGDKVRATRVVTTLVEGMQARVNRDNDDDVRYLPIAVHGVVRIYSCAGYGIRGIYSGGTIGRRSRGLW